jgi:hypothetical protein
MTPDAIGLFAPLASHQGLPQLPEEKVEVRPLVTCMSQMQLFRDRMPWLWQAVHLEQGCGEPRKDDGQVV